VHTFVLSHFILFVSSLGQGHMAGLWILLAMAVAPSAEVGLLANRQVVLGT